MTANITVGQNFKPVAFACYQNIKLTAKSDLVLHFVGSDNKKKKALFTSNILTPVPPSHTHMHKHTKLPNPHDTNIIGC